MEKDLKVYKKIKINGFKTTVEHIYYNLDQKVAEITICEEKKEDVFMVDEERYITDKTIVKNLTKKELKNLESRIKNNRLVIVISEGDTVEIEKATRHLSKNETRLVRIKKFVNENYIR